MFCDFPERREYRPFVAATLDPRSELGAFGTGLGNLVKIKDPALRWMNIGFHWGPEVLIKAVGWIEGKSNQTQDSSPLEEAERTLLISAGLKAQRGELTLDSPEFLLLKTCVSAKAKQALNSTPIPDAPEAMSMSKTWNAMVKNFTQTQIGEYLEATKEFQAGAEPPTTPKDPPNDVENPSGGGRHE